MIGNGMNVSYVIGQTSFTGDAGGTTQSTFDFTYGQANNGCSMYHPHTTHLFVCDTYNNRVMIFDGSAINTSSPSPFIPGYD